MLQSSERENVDHKTRQKDREEEKEKEKEEEKEEKGIPKHILLLKAIENGHSEVSSQREMRAEKKKIRGGRERSKGEMIMVGVEYENLIILIFFCLFIIHSIILNSVFFVLFFTLLIFILLLFIGI